MSESSKPRGTSRLPRAQREEMLLDAATEEFGSMGYGGASLGSIADRAEVSKALLVTYFGSKDGLYGACAQRAGTNLADRIEAVITQDFTAGDMALRTLAAIFTGLEARPLDWNVLNDRTAPHDSPGGACARAQRQRIEEQATRAVASLKQLSDLDADNAELLTGVWSGAVSSVVSWWLHHPDRTPAEMTARCATVVSALLEQ